MSPALPRPLLWVGIPSIILALGGAIFAWLRWGDGVFFDTIVGGMSVCL